jgi:Zn-dependent protease/CBS domain-containing protein
MSLAAGSPDVGGTIKLLRIRGIPLYIHASWLVVYALITWTLAVGYFPEVLPGRPALGYWVSGLVAALLLFVSVLVHELSHAFVAQRHGLTVRGITLHVFGGVSEIEDEPPGPAAEFLIAVVGPLTSFAIAAVLGALLAAGVAPSGAPRAIFAYLVTVNVAVGLFNLIPGFPLDGGRLLRAILWRWTGSLARATAVASRVGGLFALALITLGVVQIVTGRLVSGIWLTLIGLFLRGAADMSSVQTALREALGALPVRTAMARDVVSMPVGTTVDALVRAFWTHHFTSFPVVEDGRVVGLVTVHQLHRVPQGEWATRTVQDVMTPVSDAFVVRPGDTLLHALEKVTRNGLGRVAVLDDGGRLAGYLSLKDITHVLALQGVTDAESKVAPGGARPELGRAA